MPASTSIGAPVSSSPITSNSPPTSDNSFIGATGEDGYTVFPAIEPPCKFFTGVSKGGRPSMAGGGPLRLGPTVADRATAGGALDGGGANDPTLAAPSVANGARTSSSSGSSQSGAAANPNDGFRTNHVI